MKTIVMGVISLVCALSYGALSGSDAAWETVIEWSPKIGYDGTNTYKSGAPHNKDFFGTGGTKTKLVELTTDGATLPGSDGAAPDSNSLRLGRALSQTGTKNFWMQPVDLKGVNGASGVWGTDINADPYIYAVSNQQIKMSIKVSDINMASNQATNGKFVFNLWDKKKPDGSPNNNGNYIGLMIHDPNNGNQEHLRLSTYGTPNMFETGTLSNGTASNPAEQNKRVTAYYITPSNGSEVMSDSGSYTFDLRFDRVTGEYAVDVNGTQVLSGQMATNQNGIAGIDCYGWEFNNVSPGDSIDIESFSISSISEIVPVLEPVDVYYQLTSDGTNVFDTISGYTPNTNGNLLTQSSFANLGSEINWTNFIEVGNSVAWSASTPTVAGTNATRLTSIWDWKAEGSGGPGGGNDNVTNNGIVLTHGEDVWAAPGAGDFVQFGNTYTKFNIDHDVSLAALAGNGRVDQGHELGPVISIKDGGSLTVEGTTGNGYGLGWLDGLTQLGNWGNSNTAPYAMTLEVDGGNFTNPGKVNVAHAKAAGHLNMTTNGGTIAVGTLQVGHDAVYRSTGTVDIAEGSLTVDKLWVGMASPGVVNVPGGQLIVPTNGAIRIGSTRSNVTSSQHGASGVGTVNFNGSGLVDISGGTLNATSSNTFVNVGYDDNLAGGTNAVEALYGGSSKTAELRIRDGGTATFTAGNKLIVGRFSDAILTVATGGTLDVSGEVLSIGYGPANATMNITGGAITSTGRRIEVGGWGGGSAMVNMTGGTVTADSLVMQNAGGTNEAVSVFNQIGGTVNITGGEARFGLNGDAVYNVGGGNSTALLSVNPLSLTNAEGQSVDKINLSYNDYDSTLNILSNGVVQLKTITLDSVNFASDSPTDSAVLNLNEGGTFIVESNWGGAIGVTNGAAINISGGQILWRRGINAAVTDMQSKQNYISLTGGGSEAPEGSVEVFTDGDYTLFAYAYNPTNASYANGSEAYPNENYVRFVSVDNSSIAQSPYEQWVAGFAIDSLSVTTNDYDGDGVANILEYALGGDPTNSADVGQTETTGTMQKLGEEFDRLMLVHPRLKGDHGLTYTAEHVGNLVFGAWSPDGVVEEGVDSRGVMDMVTNSVPATNSAGFLRLKVQLAE